MIIKHEDKTGKNQINNNVTYNGDVEYKISTKKIKLDPSMIYSPITPALMTRDCAKKIEPIDIKKFGKSIKNIGKGTYGKVDLHIEKKTGKEVVIKSAFGNHDDECTFADTKKCTCGAYELTGDVVREVSALSTLNPHPNIVKMIGVNYMESPMKVVLEKAEDTLWGYIKQKKVHGDTKLTKKIMYHIIRGIHWMNNIGIWHRDIKPQNILIMPDGRAVIADFGLARGHPFKWDNLTDIVYTIWWRPPEILMSQCLPSNYTNTGENHSYDAKAEIWALGMCLWDILSANGSAQRYLRSDDCSEELQLWKILRCFDNGDTAMNWKLGKDSVYNYMRDKSKSKDFKNSWTEISKKNDDGRSKVEHKLGYKLNNDTWDLFKGMMNLCPDKRLNINDVLNHGYFDSVRKEIDSKYPVPIRQSDICHMNTKGILPENWQTICSWIWNAVVQYNINYSVYFLALHIMRCYFFLKKSKENDIQLIGVASLNLSALYMGNESEVDEFKSELANDGVLKRKQIANMEKSILSEVGNILHVPTSWYESLSYFTENDDVDYLAEILACVESSPTSYTLSSNEAAEICWNIYHKIVNKRKKSLKNVEKDVLAFIKKFKCDPDSEPMFSVMKKHPLS